MTIHLRLERERPCVWDSITRWHARHGFVYDVEKYIDGRKMLLGVIYGSISCGDIAFVHFDTLPGVRLTVADFRTVSRKLFKLLSGFGAIMTTVPEGNARLINLLCRRFDFAVIQGADYLREGQKIKILKYLKS